MTQTKAETAADAYASNISPHLMMTGFTPRRVFVKKVRGRPKTIPLTSARPNSVQVIELKKMNEEMRKILEETTHRQNAKPDDLEVNPMKSKQLTNFRSTGKDDAIRLTPPKRLTLEQAIAYIDDDEMVEVTPKNIRLRKRLLDPNERKKASRAKQAA